VQVLDRGVEILDIQSDVAAAEPRMTRTPTIG